jgi:hypothetical protein
LQSEEEMRRLVRTPAETLQIEWNGSRLEENSRSGTNCAAQEIVTVPAKGRKKKESFFATMKEAESCSGSK